jgi:hypothetical protein
MTSGTNAVNDGTVTVTYDPATDGCPATTTTTTTTPIVAKFTG